MKNNQSYILIFSIACLIHQITMPMRPKLPTMIPAPFGPSRAQSSTFAAPGSTVSSTQIQEATQQQFYPPQPRRLPFMSAEEINYLARQQEQLEDFENLEQISAEAMVQEIIDAQALTQEVEQLPPAVETPTPKAPLQSKQATTTLTQFMRGAKSTRYPFATFAPGQRQLHAPQAEILQEPPKATELRKKSLPKTATPPLTVARHLRPAPKKSDVLEKIAEDAQVLETIEEAALSNPLEDLTLLVEKTTIKPERRTLPETQELTELQQTLNSQEIPSNLDSSTSSLAIPPMQQSPDLRKTSASIPTVTMQPKMSSTIPAQEKIIRVTPEKKEVPEHITVSSIQPVTQTSRLQRIEKEFTQQPTLTPQPSTPSAQVITTSDLAPTSSSSLQSLSRPKALQDSDLALTPPMMSSTVPAQEKIIRITSTKKEAPQHTTVSSMQPITQTSRIQRTAKKLEQMPTLTPQPSTPSAQVITTSDLPVTSPSLSQSPIQKKSSKAPDLTLTLPKMSSTIPASAKVTDDESLQGLNLLFAKPRQEIEKLPVTPARTPQRRTSPTTKTYTELQENITPPSATPTLTTVEQMPNTIELIAPLQQQEKESLVQQLPVLPIAEVEIPTELIPKKSEEVLEPAEEEAIELFSVPSVLPTTYPAMPDALTAPAATPNVQVSTSSKPAASRTTTVPSPKNAQQSKAMSDTRRRLFPKNRQTLKPTATQQFMPQNAPRTFDQIFQPYATTESPTLPQPKYQEYDQAYAAPYAPFTMNEPQQQEDFIGEEPELFENLSDEDWQALQDQYPAEEFNLLDQQPAPTEVSTQQPITISSHTTKALPKISTKGIATPTAPEIMRTPRKNQTIPTPTAQPATTAPAFPLASIFMSIGVIIIASLLFLI